MHHDCSDELRERDVWWHASRYDVVGINCIEAERQCIVHVLCTVAKRRPESCIKHAVRLRVVENKVSPSSTRMFESVTPLPDASALTAVTLH